MANDPLDTLATGYAADRVTGLVRGALWSYLARQPDDQDHDPGLLAQVVTEAMRAEPAALLAFCAEVTAALAASDLVPGFRRGVPTTVDVCSWCGRRTLINEITYRGQPTGYQTCGTCRVSNRIYQPPAGHHGPWPPT